MKQDDLQRLLEAIGKSGINVAGDLVLEKNVEYEVNNVENGGIGIQIVNDKEKTPLTVSDKDIKSVVEGLLKEKDKDGEPIFKNKKQWWAVYRVLGDFCNYPSKMTTFVSKMKDLELDNIDAKRMLTYESLAAAPKDVPLMGCIPSNWGTLKDKSENYMQQYVVAEYLMLELGIKS